MLVTDTFTHKLTWDKANKLFDYLRYTYQNDIINSSGKSFDQWRSMYKEVLAYRKGVGSKPTGDCEDCAFTWGEAAYRDFQVPRGEILLVRGLSPTGQQKVEETGKPREVDHAWAFIGGWVFDIWENTPVDATNCKHNPFDFITMDTPLDVRLWNFD